jgi:hypothetical protein
MNGNIVILAWHGCTGGANLIRERDGDEQGIRAS